MSVQELTQTLLRFKSVTPHDAGTMDCIQSILEPMGFMCHRVIFGDVTNFYARLGNTIPHICFLGHTDVVPAPMPETWRHDPFAGICEDGMIYGRGAVDMKGSVACFIAAVQQVVHSKNSNGSISILLTSDEEGTAQNGIKQMIPWLRDRGEFFDFCLGGEPTNPTHLGEMIKVGRRGSLTMAITVQGQAGHVAYPAFAHNPVPALVGFLHQLTSYVFDTGTDAFDQTHLEITTIDVGNPTSNMIPTKAAATVNVRFAPTYTTETLKAALLDQLEKARALSDAALQWDVDFRPTGDAFYNNDPELSALVANAVRDVTGLMPVLSTTGGTSDARFMKDLCPVVEFGLLSCHAHQVDERVSVSDLEQLTAIYQKIIENYLGI